MLIFHKINLILILINNDYDRTPNLPALNMLKKVDF